MSMSYGDFIREAKREMLQASVDRGRPLPQQVGSRPRIDEEMLARDVLIADLQAQIDAARQKKKKMMAIQAKILAKEEKQEVAPATLRPAP